MANTGVGDHGKLDAKANHYAHHQNADEELEDPQAPHVTSRIVEEEDEHDINDGESTSCYKRYLGRQEVEGDGGTNNLDRLACVFHPSREIVSYLRNIRRYNSNLSQSVYGIVQPSWEKGSTC